MYKRAVNGKKLTKKKLEIFQLLQQYNDSLSTDEFDLGLTHLAEHKIEKGNARPIKQATRRVPMALSGEEKQAIDTML